MCGMDKNIWLAKTEIYYWNTSQAMKDMSCEYIISKLTKYFKSDQTSSDTKEIHLHDKKLF